MSATNIGPQFGPQIQCNCHNCQNLFHVFFWVHSTCVLCIIAASRFWIQCSEHTVKCFIHAAANSWSWQSLSFQIWNGLFSNFENTILSTCILHLNSRVCHSSRTCSLCGIDCCWSSRHRNFFFFKFRERGKFKKPLWFSPFFFFPPTCTVRPSVRISHRLLKTAHKHTLAFFFWCTVVALFCVCVCILSSRHGRLAAGEPGPCCLISSRVGRWVSEWVVLCCLIATHIDLVRGGGLCTVRSFLWPGDRWNENAVQRRGGGDKHRTSVVLLLCRACVVLVPVCLSQSLITLLHAFFTQL